MKKIKNLQVGMKFKFKNGKFNYKVTKIVYKNGKKQVVYQDNLGTKYISHKLLYDVILIR